MEESNCTSLHSSPVSSQSMMSSPSLSRNVPNHELVSKLPEATATKMPASTALPTWDIQAFM